MKHFDQAQISAVGSNVMTSFNEVYKSERDREIGDKVQPIVEEFFSALPIGYNVDTTYDDYYKTCCSYVNSQYQEQYPVGMFVGILPSFIFISILSGIISWLVQKYLDHLWGQ